MRKYFIPYNLMFSQTCTMYMHVDLSIYLSIYLFIYLSIYLSIYRSNYLPCQALWTHEAWFPISFSMNKGRFCRAFGSELIVSLYSHSFISFVILLYIYSLFYTFIHPFIHLFIILYIYTSFHSFIYYFIHLYILSFIYSLFYTFIHPFIH